ncbi:MAG: trypsin-like peptidase domain-containing protein [Micropepsaceae bacterium]
MPLSSSGLRAAVRVFGWAALIGMTAAGLASAKPAPTASISGMPALVATSAVSLSSWADIVDRVSPAVVSLTTTKGLGSGFVIDPSGYIVTNNHVMSGTNEAEVRFADGSKFKGRLIGRDEATDIALLKVDAPNSFPSLKFDDDKRVRVGDLVLAVGNPFGLNGTVTAGILSARGRDEIGSGQFTDYLQLDAAINPGNSGGPTFDSNGRVIGMNSMGRPGSGIGFAIPSSTIMRVVEDLKAGRAVTRGYLGVQIESLSDETAKAVGLPNSNGALVTGVIEGSPAAKAGIRRGDVILEINGDAVKDNRELARKIAALVVGQTATFTLWRDGARTKIKVTAAKRDLTAETILPTDGTRLTSMGLALQSITDTVRKDFHLADDARGVLVMGIDPASDAAARGLNPGDRIVAVGSVDVTSMTDVNLALEKARSQKRDSVLLFVVTANGASTHTAVKLDAK